MSKITMKKIALIQLFTDLEKHKQKGISIESLDEIDKQTFYLNKSLDILILSFGIILFFLSQKFIFLLLIIPYILYFYKK